MSAVNLKMIELVDDLLARLADKQIGVLDDRRVDLFECELSGDLAKMREEPAPQPHLVRIEIPGSSRRTKLGLRHQPGGQESTRPPITCRWRWKTV